MVSLMSRASGRPSKNPVCPKCTWASTRPGAMNFPLRSRTSECSGITTSSPPMAVIRPSLIRITLLGTTAPVPSKAVAPFRAKNPESSLLSGVQAVSRAIAKRAGKGLVFIMVGWLRLAGRFTGPTKDSVYLPTLFPDLHNQALFFTALLECSRAVMGILV